jgi:hypothetical protein
LGVSLAQAQNVTYKFDYAGYGSFENKSSVDDNAGCRRQADWVGKYAFRQDWKLLAITRPHGISIHRDAVYAGARGLAGYPMSLDVTGSQVTQPGQACEWAGGSNDTGTFQCGDDHPTLFYDKVLDISGAGKKVIFRAPAFITSPDQTGKSCLLVTKGPNDVCTVEQDSYTGEIAVKRIS